MNELKVLSYDLRKHVVDMIIAGKAGISGANIASWRFWWSCI